MELYPTIRNHRKHYPPVQMAFKEAYFLSIKDGTILKESYSKMGKPKSHKQCKAMFAVPVELVRLKLKEMHIDVCCCEVNREQVYDILKKACFGVGDHGETLGLSEMTTEQANQAYKNCQQWAASQIFLDIPDPDPNWREKKKAKQ